MYVGGGDLKVNEVNAEKDKVMVARSVLCCYSWSSFGTNAFVRYFIVI